MLCSTELSTHGMTNTNIYRYLLCRATGRGGGKLSVEGGNAATVKMTKDRTRTEIVFNAHSTRFKSSSGATVYFATTLSL